MATEFNDLTRQDEPEPDENAPLEEEGFSPGERRVIAVIGALVLLVLLAMVFHRGPFHRDKADTVGSVLSVGPHPAPTLDEPDPLALYPRINPIAAKIIGPDYDQRRKLHDLIEQARLDRRTAGLDDSLCSFYFGLNADGWAIQFQHPGSEALPNRTYSVWLFVDTSCAPTAKSPLITYAPMPTTTTAPGPPPSSPNKGDGLNATPR